MNINFTTPEDLVKKVESIHGPILNQSPYYLNIVAFRKNRIFTNRFDDLIYWLWKDDNNNWQWSSGKITTKPGYFYVKNPLSNKGVGILKPGYYKKSHKLGLHKGSYKALVQQTNLTVYRDNDKDEWADYITEENGLFGINIHRSNAQRESVSVDKWSAACLVFANPFVYFSFIKQCEVHASHHSNNFDLILI